MKEKNAKQFANSAQDNLMLNEDEAEVVNNGFVLSLILHLKNLKNFLRRFFIKKNEKSLVVFLIENAYYILLSCKMKVFATFLFTFGIVSAVLGIFISNSVGEFLAYNGTFTSLCIIVSGLLMFISGKTLEDAISNSAIFSPLNMVYSQPGLLSCNRVAINTINAYSTAFFVGFIAGLFTIIFPALSILKFLLLLLCALFIFNRPECGILVVSFLLPFFTEYYVIIFSFVVFAALIYKYLLGKRHINFSFSETVSLIAVVYITVFHIGFHGGENSVVTCIAYTLFFIIFVSTSNLVRSTSMYRRSVYIVLSLSRIYAFMLLCYYFVAIFIGTNFLDNIFENNNLSGLNLALAGKGFVLPMIAISIPLNLSYVLSVNKKSEVLKGTICLIVLFACVLFNASLFYCFIVLASCVAVLAFKKKRFIFAIFVVPFGSYAFVKVYQLLPDSFRYGSMSRVANTDGAMFSLFRNANVEQSQLTIKDYLVNNVLHVTDRIGFIGTVLVAIMIIYVLIVSIKGFSDKNYFTANVKLLSVGQIVASFVYILVSVSSNYLADVRIMFIFAVIVSLSYSSVQCYEADYIDEYVVRDYLT